MRRGRKKILKNLSFGKIVPNLATLFALLTGMTQVKFALKEQWEFAVIAVVAAAFLDATDGRLARLFNACSRFGAELDSLSDFAVFGLCPAIVMYLYSLSSLNRLGWMISAFFSVCVCLRLARFNVHDIENIKTPLSWKFFTGVPAPAGAILALFPIILFNAFELNLFKNEYLCGANILIAGLLCISKIPTLSIKNLRIERSQYTLFLLGMILFMGIIFAYTWRVFCIIVLAYLASIFVCSRSAKRILKNSNDQLLTNK
ncbi:MAG: CDP-alcohol phosphatidyltransferase family protein [Holosporales bacterium]|jgi:CDP-diacylglycerol--serine O-phosphatidyltransferase|nr:CDP-alcohol phosphatidyltransferase family protein [Holosporales bacterium]